MDGLDIPVVNMLDASFAEHYAGGTKPVVQEGGDSPFSFPYARMRALAKTAAGARIHYGGESTMPTIDAWLSLLPPGHKTEAYRSTDATVFCVAEGHGQSRIGDDSGDTFSWAPHDIFMAPSWVPVTHEAKGESVLFSFSDRPIQKALGLWREGH